MLSAVPQPAHVVIVIEENHDYSQIIGSANAPYINALAQQGALMTASTGVEHPSQPNYLDLFSGSNQGVTNDKHPAGSPFTTANLGAELLTADDSFTGYSESLPSVGFDGDSYTSVVGQNQYMRKHNPWADFINTPAGANQMPASVNQPFASFPTDYTKLPTVSIVVPNEQNDMHDGTVQEGDTWLQTNIDGYAQWAKTHNSLLVVTWDEDDTSTMDNPPNHITTIFVGQTIQPGKYGESINHYNVLRTVEDMFNLPYAGASASATPITDIWAPPKLAIGGPAVTYNTGGAPIAVAPAATLSTGDGLFADASLSVTNTSGGGWDRLSIRASGSLTISGTTLSYNGTAVGTFTGGASKTPLTVTFNSDATQAAILAVVHNVTYHSAVLNPSSLSNRSVSFQLIDGAGNHGAVVKQTVDMTTPPVLAIGGAAVTYSRGGAAIAIAPAATLSSGDGKFAKSSLSVVDTTFSSYQSDRLSIQSSGSLVVNGTSLVYGGVTIGTFTGSKGTLAITFNSSATQMAILAVARNVTFTNINPTATIANRSITFQLKDGSGNLGAPVKQTVQFE